MAFWPEKKYKYVYHGQGFETPELQLYSLKLKKEGTFWLFVLIKNGFLESC